MARKFSLLLGFWDRKKKDYRNLYLFAGAAWDILASYDFFHAARQFDSVLNDAGKSHQEQQ
ncbi:hypothetical protein BKX93_01225 [Chromobacterium vaccinii]|uniref:Uncharacterized protein n=1 Tax=Chromobacterium vaccinii TaxID=1108595 RepID=A0A1D9LBU4_9NEIS|nr:hypothetical protein BKX93_01225 [Chromobacterium vaccinii]